MESAILLLNLYFFFTFLTYTYLITCQKLPTYPTTIDTYNETILITKIPTFPTRRASSKSFLILVNILKRQNKYRHDATYTDGYYFKRDWISNATAPNPNYKRTDVKQLTSLVRRNDPHRCWTFTSYDTSCRSISS